MGRLTLPDIKTSYKDTVKHYGTDIFTDEWNSISVADFQKGCQVHSMEKKKFLQTIKQ